MDRRTDRAGTRGAASLLLGVGLSFGAALGQDDPKDLIEVTGTVVVEDGKGGEVTDATGNITVGMHEGNGWRPQKVFLIDGEWKIRIQKGYQLSFEVFALDDGIAYWLLEDEAPGKHGRDERRDQGLPIPPDGRLAIRARFAPPCVIHVVDAETGAELAGVDALLDVVHYGPGLRNTGVHAHSLGEGQLHPTWWNPGDVRVHAAQSPLSLTIDDEDTFPRWTQDLWVHAPGYCWAGVSLDYQKGGEQTVKLARGSMLEVAIDGEQLPEATKIVVRSAADATKRPIAEEEADEETLSEEEDDAVDVIVFGGSFGASDDDSLLEWPVRAGKTAKFDGIPPGRYRVSLEIGERFRGKPKRFAECEIEVKAGEPALARLTANEVPKAPEPISLAGTIKISPEWGDLDFDLTLSPRDVSPLVTQEPIRLDRKQLIRDPVVAGAWKLPDRKFAPGTYELGLDPFGIRRSLLLVRATLPITVEVGSPVDVTFRFVDAKSNAPLPVENVSWFVVEPGVDSFGGSFSWRDSEPATDVHKFRVPEGRIGLRPHVDGYETFGEYVFDVAADQADITVPLRHHTGVRVLFRIEGKITEWDEALSSMKSNEHGFDFIDYDPELRPKDPAKAVAEGDLFHGSGPSGEGRYYSVETAGEYQIAFPPIKGFEPIESRDVKIVDQEFTEVVIDLVRTKS